MRKNKHQMAKKLTQLIFNLKHLIGFSFSILVLGLFSPLIAYATVSPAGTYTWIYMPANNLTTISHDVTINNVTNLGNADYFWSHQFYFMGGPEGEGAYIGIQGINRAVFSIFDYASTEVSPSCNVQQAGFDGYDESGTSCIISYPITQGHTYQLQVTNIGQDSQGINWLGTVTDLTTNQTTDIATVNVDSSWGDISDLSVVWTEDFGSAVDSCNEYQYSNVTFSNFEATDMNDVQYTAPSSNSDNISQNSCTPSSFVTDNNSNSFTQGMGYNPPSVNISSISNNSEVYGNAFVLDSSATANDNGTISNSGLYLNAGLIQALTDPPYNFTFNALGYPDGAYTVTVEATDDQSETTSSQVPVYISNGDLNFDGQVNISDLAILASNWDQTGQTYAEGSINGSGTVDISDLAILAANWGWAE